MADFYAGTPKDVSADEAALLGSGASAAGLVGFSNASIRMGFIRKVFAILCLQVGRA